MTAAAGQAVAKDAEFSAAQRVLSDAISVSLAKDANLLAQRKEAVDAMVKQIAQTKGITEAQARHTVEIEKTRDKLAAASKVMTGYLDALGGKVQALGQGFTTMGDAAAIGFAAAGASLIGFVRSGLQASALGQILGFHMERLSLTIAGLFGPELRKIVDWIGNLVVKLQSLTKEQKESIASFAKAALAGLAVAMVLPRIFSGAMMVAAGVKVLAASMLGLSVASGGILPLIGAVASALTAIGAGMVVKDGGFGALLEKLAPFAAKAQEIGEKLGAAFLPLAEKALPTLRAMLGLLDAVVNVAVSLATAFAPVVDVLASALPTAIGVLAAAVQLLADVMDSMVGKWALWTVLIGRSIAVIPAAVAAVYGFVAALGKLIVAQIVALSLMGPKGWAILAGAAVAAGAAIAGAATVLGRENQRVRSVSGRNPDQNRNEEAKRLGGPEDMLAMYFRISQLTQAATAGRESHDDIVERRLEAIEMNTGGTQRAVRDIPPAFA